MKTIMALVNQYDEIVAELERDGDFFYRLPYILDLLCEGDEFRVEAIEVED